MEGLYVPTCQACGAGLPVYPGKGRPKLFCSDTCRKRYSRTRQAKRFYSPPPPRLEGDPREGFESIRPDERTAMALADALSLAGELHRLGCDARPQLAWRCESVAQALDKALESYFSKHSDRRFSSWQCA